MSNIDVILEQPDLVVLGGPSIVEVQLDTGATGTRGSLTYAGAGLPSAQTIPNYSSILPGDLYINIAPGTNYSWMYQYVVKPGGPTWEPIVSLTPALFNAVYSLAFVAGQATITIPVNNIITTSANLTSDNFAVALTFENNNPIAFSITNKTVSSGNLVIGVKAVEFDGTSWIAYAENPARVSVAVRVISGTTVI